MTEAQPLEDTLSNISAVKDEILEILNRLRETTSQLQQGLEVPSESIKVLFSRGETLALKIGAIQGMSQAGDDFRDHLNKIGKAIRDLQNFDALKKENLVTGVKF